MSLPKLIAFSPRSYLTAAVTTTGAENFVLNDISIVPELAEGEYAYLVISSTRNFSSDDPTEYEVIKFETVNEGDSRVEDTTRGVEGTAQTWEIGDWCACLVTKAHFDDLETYIDAHIDNTTDAHNIDDYLPLAGGTMAGDVNFGLNALTKYTEGTPAEQTHSDSGSLTLNVSNGLLHIINMSNDITSVIISNAPAGEVTSLLLRLIADDTHAMTWIANTTVISASTGVDASTTDDSFNSSAAFADVLQLGDLITVSGFTESANNGEFRVISATTSKIVVDANLTTEAAGDSITISRHNLYPEAPDAPAAYVPTDYVLWTYDGTRWNISKVGEF